MEQVQPYIVEHQQIILDSITDGVFTVDLDWRVTSFNKAAEAITGIPREAAIGQLCYEVFRANVCERGCILQQTMKTGEAIRNMPIYIVRGDKNASPSVSARPC